MQVRVYIWGCHQTTILKIICGEVEVAFLQRLALESQKLGGGCLPTITMDTV